MSSIEEKKKNSIESLKLADKRIIITYLVLAFIGVVAVFSASAFESINVPLIQTVAFKQMLFVIVGVIGIAMITIIPAYMFTKTWLVYSYGLISIALLFGLRFLGIEVNGARAWYNLGFFNFQPLEIAKISIVLLLSHNITKSLDELPNRSFGGVIKEMAPSLILILFIIGLLLQQPDIGGILIIGLLCLAFLFVSGVRNKIVFGVFVSLGAAVAGLLLAVQLGWVNFLESYQLARLTSFMNPFADEFGSGLQLINGLYALRRGGWLGVGLGQSQQKMGYLPEVHTDFIFAIIGEEVGIVGITVILVVFFGFLYFLFSRAKKLRGIQEQYIVYGLVSLLAIQAFVNLGSLVGLMPITGVTFPFISYGGSSFISGSIIIGIIVNILLNNTRQNLA